MDAKPLSDHTDKVEIPSEGILINKETLIQAANTKKRKISIYDSYGDRGPDNHLSREGWNKAFNYLFPEDVYLGIETSIERSVMPSQFQEIYKRFYNLGFIYNYGNQCILMSSLLRRVLRLHGFQSSSKQVICWWAKDEKGQKATVGVGNSPSSITPGSIDAHMVATCQGFILDFALSPINSLYGATAPCALIGLDNKSDEYQDFGISGQAAWQDVSPQHPIVKHWRLEQKSIEIELTKEYFRKYQF